MNVQMSRLVDHDIRLWLITGQTLTLSPREHWSMFLDIDSAIFFAACFCLITFLFPVPADVYIPWWMKLAGFGIFLLLIPIVYFMQVLLVARITISFPGFYFFEPVLLFVTALAIEIFDNNVQPLLFGGEWRRWVDAVSFGEQVTGTFLLLLTLHILFCFFVLPRKTNLRIADNGFAEKSVPAVREVPTVVHPDVRLVMPGQADDVPKAISPEFHAPAPQVEHTATVELDGYEMPLSTILAVKAEEHYVRVWTEEREIYARHSFGALMSRMNEDGGFSPRRGIWLHFKNISEIRKEETGKYVVVPFKGPETVVPKAQARKVRQLMRRLS